MKFSVLATFSGYDLEGFSPDVQMMDLRRDLEGIAGLSFDATEPGDSEYSYFAIEDGDPGSPWARAYDITVSGILDRSAFWQFWDTVGPYAENCETMGTLGGPANWSGLAPDVSCCLESQWVVASIRVTPLPEHGERDGRAWSRIRRAFLNIFGLHKVGPDGRDIPRTYPDAWRSFRRSDASV